MALGLVGRLAEMADDEDVRRIALALPETSEKPSYGMPGFRVKNKAFARLHEMPGVLVLWLADESEKHALIASEPEKFFTTPHYDGFGSVLLRLAAVDTDELTDLLTESWRVRAPTRLRATFDQS